MVGLMLAWIVRRLLHCYCSPVKLIRPWVFCDSCIMLTRSLVVRSGLHWFPCLQWCLRWYLHWCYWLFLKFCIECLSTSHRCFVAGCIDLSFSFKRCFVGVCIGISLLLWLLCVFDVCIDVPLVIYWSCFKRCFVDSYQDCFIDLPWTPGGWLHYWPIAVSLIFLVSTLMLSLIYCRLAFALISLMDHWCFDDLRRLFIAGSLVYAVVLIEFHYVSFVCHICSTECWIAFHWCFIKGCIDTSLSHDWFAIGCPFLIALRSVGFTLGFVDLYDGFFIESFIDMSLIFTQFYNGLHRWLMEFLFALISIAVLLVCPLVFLGCERATLNCLFLFHWCVINGSSLKDAFNSKGGHKLFVAVCIDVHVSCRWFWHGFPNGFKDVPWWLLSSFIDMSLMTASSSYWFSWMPIEVSLTFALIVVDLCTTSPNML